MGDVQAWLEDFAWTEEEKASKLAQRNAEAPRGRGRDLAGQPMFCLETAMHCLYWSHLVYDYREVRGSLVTGVAKASCQTTAPREVQSVSRVRRLHVGLGV